MPFVAAPGGHGVLASCSVTPYLSSCLLIAHSSREFPVAVVVRGINTYHGGERPNGSDGYCRKRHPSFFLGVSFFFATVVFISSAAHSETVSLMREPVHVRHGQGSQARRVRQLRHAIFLAPISLYAQEEPSLPPSTTVPRRRRRRRGDRIEDGGSEATLPPLRSEVLAQG